MYMKELLLGYEVLTKIKYIILCVYPTQVSKIFRMPVSKVLKCCYFYFRK